ncbi:MAG: asparagine synthase (glutamine-hydrolyzing) [Rickettsiales bacterium]|nr:asparagine synthase (glutamine-hydrolyzing) [Rickettsiales bacterium]
MCGILGTIPPTSSKRFQTALDTLRHRGPDSGDIWQNEQISLGHRRLSILDISDLASQPMHYKNRYHITFNGEIYNFLEIKESLENLGFRFKTLSDTEVLLYSFVQWGEECVNKLNGMWAFGIWDSHERKLFLSRDRMGEKPLFYSFNNGKFIFASEQKAILPFLKKVEPSKNFTNLIKNPYLYEGTENTLFNNVYRFPAASNGWLIDSQLTINKYWSVFDNKINVPNSYAEQINFFSELLEDSISIRMRSDVPIGTALSGGVDSSTIAAYVSKNGNKGGNRISANWQNAFTACFPGSIMDESSSARCISEHLNINLNEILIDPSQSIKDIQNYPYMLEEIHEVNPIPHIQLYRRMRENGVLVTLDGHGGDELFAGYESSILHAIPDNILNFSGLKNVLRTYKDIHPDSKQFQGMGIFKIILYLFKSEFDQRKRIKNSFQCKSYDQYDHLNRHLLDLSFCTVMPTLLRNYDRYSMMSGVEIRIPFLDHRIIEFAFSIGQQSKIKDGYSKSILRDSSRKMLPKDIIDNKSKIGFAPPIIDWVQGPLKEYILDEIDSSSFRNSSLINSNKLKTQLFKVINNNQSMKLYDVERIWKTFNIFLWEKAFLIRK